MLHRCLIIGFALLAGCQAPLIPQGSGIATTGVAQPAVVSIYTWQPRGLTGSRAQGTGFCTAPNEILTNLHVIEGATAAAARFADGIDREVEAVVGEDPDADLVLLRLKPGARDEAPLVVSNAPLPIGADIRIVGSPDGAAQTQISGRIASNTVTFDVLDEAIMLSATVEPGMSGSPVLDETGGVVGIVSRGTNVAAQSYMVPASRLRSMHRFEPMPLAKWSQWKSSQPSNAGRITFGSAAIAFESGDYAEAIRLLQTAVGQGLTPAGHATAWYVMGDAHANLGRDNDAVDAYQRAVKIRPAHALAHGALALALRRQGRHAEAVGAYDNALKLMPTLSRFHVGRGWALLRMAKPEDAAAAFELGTRLDPANVGGWTGRASSALATGEHEAARDHARQATTLGPRVEQAWWVLAAAEQSLGAYETAAQAWETGLELAPDEPRALFELARTRLAMGQRAASRRLLTRLQDLGSPLAAQLEEALRGA